MIRRCEQQVARLPRHAISKSTAADCDGDTYTAFAEETHGSNPFDVGSVPADHYVFANDAGCDACYDSAEPGLTPAANPSDPWDFYDVPVPTLGNGGHISGTDNRDHAVSIIVDVLLVLAQSGQSCPPPP